MITHYDESMRMKEPYGSSYRAVISDLASVGPSNITDAVKRAAASLDWSTMMTYQIFAMARYASYGHITYDVGPVMQAMLSSTSVKGLTGKDLRFPVDCFYVNLSKCDWHFWVGEKIGWAKVRGAYVTKGCLHGAPEEESFSVAVYGHVPGTVAGSPEGTAMFWFSLLSDHDDLDAALTETLQSANNQVIGYNPYEEPMLAVNADHVPYRDKKKRMTVEELSRLNVLALNRCLLNLMVYLGSENAETKKAPKSARRRSLEAKLKKADQRQNFSSARKIMTQIDRMSKASVTYIGWETERKHAAKRVGTKGVRGSLGRMWRTGHYRRQWVGPKQDENGLPQLGDKQVLRWIEPYEINKDMAVNMRKRLRKVREPSVHQYVGWKRKRGQHG
jgi:hypothetical protein